MNASLREYLNARAAEFDKIPEERRSILDRLGTFARERIAAGETAQLIFICTHNSRRSHLAQAAALSAAEFSGYNQVGATQNVAAYSGGTEATAMFRRSVDALRDAGYHITDGDGGTDENPVYVIATGEDDAGVRFFSKRFNDAANPQGGFAAIMTCSQADAECPFVPGAAARISLPYEDPKLFDGTPRELEKYQERCRDIHREILYALRV